ncbi:Ribonuclease VapC [Verrucomicrobia bacterium]|nr:Ribonuclease VapC [Verrucomicrobiota bacterium]
MKIFCDTNVVVAAFFSNHPHHEAARPVLERVKAGRDDGFVAAHTLAETYAVLTRLPAGAQVPAGVAWQLIEENLVKNFSVVALTPKDYARNLGTGVANGVVGGRIYDALLLAAAGKCGAERIYTFNVAHFQNLAADDLRQRIAAP